MSKQEKRIKKEEEKEKKISESEEKRVPSEELSAEALEIAQLKEKVAELEELRLRDAAEFENLKKRFEKEKQNAIIYAHEQFARDLLAVIDSLDNAIASVSEESGSESVEKIKEGLNLTIEQFKKVLEKHGVTLIEVEGEFNPHVHEAVMHIESEGHKSGEIVQVLQKGYKIRDRILRPAMVSIAK